MFDLSLFSFPFLIVAAFGNLILALLVFKADPKSQSNSIFSLLAIVTTVWFFAMYYAVTPELDLFIARSTLFFATIMNITFYFFARSFLTDIKNLRLIEKIFLSVGGILSLIISLTPFGFRELATLHEVTSTVPGWGFPIFGVFSVTTNIAAIYILLRSFWRSQGAKRKQIFLVFMGVMLMFALIIGTIFIPTFIYANNYFVPLAPVYVLVFFIFSSFAILRHGLFSLKLVATGVFITILNLILLFKVGSSVSFLDTIFNILALVGTIVASIFLFQSVKAEIKEREHAERLIATLRRFIAFATHELRGPIGNIRAGLFEVLHPDNQQTSLTDKINFLNKMYEDIDDMSVTVDTFLDTNLIEMEAFKLNKTKFIFSQLLDKVFTYYLLMAEQKHIYLSLRIAPEISKQEVEFDHFKIEHVLRNLIFNALKHTENGSIEISVYRDKNLIIQISDTGSGMSADLRERLDTIHSPIATFDKGDSHGVGLWLSNYIIKSHNGSITASENKKEGRGTMVTIELPL